jgi:hypothetical protein
LASVFFVAFNIANEYVYDTLLSFQNKLRLISGRQVGVISKQAGKNFEGGVL